VRNLRACAGVFTPVSYVQNLFSDAEPERRNPGGSQVELVGYPFFASPISDLLVRLQNGFRRRHDTVSVPASRLKREVLRILQNEGYIQSVQTDVADGHAVLKVQLRYVAEGQPMVTGMQRVSKPGRRVYVGTKDIPRVKNGIGVAIVSTSKGLMTDQDSRRAGLGGEVLCSVW